MHIRKRYLGPAMKKKKRDWRTRKKQHRVETGWQLHIRTTGWVGQKHALTYYKITPFSRSKAFWIGCRIISLHSWRMSYMGEHYKITHYGLHGYQKRQYRKYMYRERFYRAV